MKKEADIFSLVSNNIYMIKLIWKISRKRVILSLVMVLLNYLEWVFYTIFFMKYLFGAAELKRGFAETASFVVIIMICFSVIDYFEAWYKNRYCPMSNQQLYYELNKKLFEKASSVDISCYENPEFYDKYTKSTKEAKERAVSVLDSTFEILVALASSVYVIYSMYCIDKVAALFTVFPVVGSLFLGSRLNKIIYNRNMDNIPYQRRQDYVNRAVYLQKYAKEIRLTNIFKVLTKNYEKAYEAIQKNIKKYAGKSFLTDYICDLFCFPFVYESLWLYAAYKAIVAKTILIGDFVILANAVNSCTWMLINLSDSIKATLENGLYINNLKQFMEYKEKISENQKGIVPRKSVDTLEFRNVSFIYAGHIKPALKDINIKIFKNETIALIGQNGSGKTTLVKLLMRLYDPTSGEILLNGVNIKEYDLKKYRNLIGTVFQDYQILSMSVAENVIMKDIAGPSEKEKAVEALKKSDIYDRVMSLKNGTDTILTKEFDDDGAVLSGGEFQKIAVARAYAKDSSIIILDEPSSALDPVAEYKMYDTIMKLCEKDNIYRNKISILISHRLSSAVMADRVIFLQNGEVLEQGSHDVLMRNNGAYADMYRKQAECYLSGEEI